MQAALDCKLHEMMKYFIIRGLQSNKYDTQLLMQLAARREVVI